MAGRVLKPRSNSKNSSLTGLLKKLAFAGLLPAVLRAQSDEFKITDGAEVTDLDTVEGSEIIEYLKNVSADQVSVLCQAQQMCIKLQKNFLEEKEITTAFQSLELNDVGQSTCPTNYIKGANDTSATHVTLCTESGFLTCGTEMHMNDTHVSYVNNVKTANEANTPSGQIMTTFLKEYVIPWHCIYPLEYIVQLQGDYYIPKISPVEIITILSPNNQKVGKFPVLMQLYKTNSYQNQFTQPPVLKDTDQLFAEVRLISAPEDAVIQIMSCWATPTGDRFGPVRYKLIDNYCVTDDAKDQAATSVIKNGKDKTARYTSNVFKFVDEERVYLHCHVRVCFPGLGEDCLKTDVVESFDSCSAAEPTRPDGEDGGSRKRRDLSQSDVEQVTDEYGTTVSLGPVYLRPDVFNVDQSVRGNIDLNRQHNILPNTEFEFHDADITAKTVFGLPMVFVYCFIAIIVIIIALVFGIIILILRRRAASKQHEKTVQIMDSNGQAFVIAPTNSSFTDNTDLTSGSGSSRSNSQIHGMDKVAPVVLLGKSSLSFHH